MNPWTLIGWYVVGMLAMSTLALCVSVVIGVEGQRRARQRHDDVFGPQCEYTWEGTDGLLQCHKRAAVTGRHKSLLYCPQHLPTSVLHPRAAGRSR